MTDKKQVVVKTYSTSWISGLFIAIVVGFIGLILVACNPLWTVAEPRLLIGFLTGFVLTFVIQLIAITCLIPFVGIYLYWIWANYFCDWFLGIAHLQILDVLRWLPLVICGFFGAIIFVIFSAFAVILLGALASAIISR